MDKEILLVQMISDDFKDEKVVLCERLTTNIYEYKIRFYHYDNLIQFKMITHYIQSFSTCSKDFLLALLENEKVTIISILIT